MVCLPLPLVYCPFVSNVKNYNDILDPLSDRDTFFRRDEMRQLGLRRNEKKRMDKAPGQDL